MKRLAFVLAALTFAGSAHAQDPGIGYTPPASSGSTDLTVPTTLGTAYGADMVTNGTFTGNATGWTLGLGGGAPDWAYSSNTVTHANGGGTATLEPSTPLTVVAGRTYRVTFTLSALTAGTVTASIGGASATAASQDGTFVQEIVAVDTTNLKFTPTTTLVATIDTISVLESKSVTIANLTAGRIPIVGTGGLLTDSAAFLADASGGGNGVLTVRKTATGASSVSNFMSFTGTFPTTLTAATTGLRFSFTTAGTSVQNIRAMTLGLAAGYTGAASVYSLEVTNSVAATSAPTDYATFAGGNVSGMFTANASGTGVQVGAFGRSTNNTGRAFGVIGVATGTSNTSSVGVVGIGNSNATVTMGGYFGAENNPYTTTLLQSAGLAAGNGSTAVPIIVASDNYAALPTTGATATWQIRDGGWSQQGNGVLTSGTATAETQARESGALVHSCTWTNAQVVALGATTAGDISCFTLPAKTVVLNAYLIITGQAGTVTTLTAAVGRTSAAYIDYIVASDAKAAAGTRYGEDAGDRGTNLTGYDQPSYSGTTAVNIHFISTGGNLSTVTGSTGRVDLITALVP